jgi:hypothetical protein
VDLRGQVIEAIRMLQAENIGEISQNAYFVDCIRRRTEEILKGKPPR